jgi:aryl-alcohol dehydrogenase-like predicted oxidoreductase
MGTMTFGGVGWAKTVGDLGVSEARKMIDICIDAGINLIDTANVYSNGLSEEIIGEALGGKRKGDVLIATKAGMPKGKGPNDGGLSRVHLIRECETSLKRLRTDVIDIYFMHSWDGTTPLDETLAALDTLVSQGKVRYVGCSNFSGWHIMKALGISEREHRERFVSQQIHYTLEARDAEYELLPVSIDQGLGVLVWSRLHRRHQGRQRGPGGALMADRPQGGDIGNHRRTDGRAVPRQPRRRRFQALR